jgi:hypothetical protein
MARNRTATNVLQLKGAFKHDPARTRVDPPTPELERPTKADLKAFRSHEEAWDYLVATMPRGILRKRDRIYIEIAAKLLYEFRRVGAHGIEPAKLVRLETMLCKLGLNPSDASRVQSGADKPRNDFDD